MRRLDVGEGTRREARGSVMWFKAVGEDTEQRFSLMERTLPPGGRMPPPHHHIGNDEAYYVLEGTVHFEIAGEQFDEGPGAFVLVAAGETHTFGNTSAEGARLLVLHAPALDQYFTELEQLWRGPEPPTRQAEQELMRRHGMEPA